MANDTLRVVASPFHSLDHLGRPCGACPRERVPGFQPGQHQGYVGAERKASEPEKLPDGHAGTPSQDVWFEFSADPVEVANTKFYRDALRNGEILPADAKSARAAGVSFVPVADALKAVKAEAAKKWRDVSGEELPGTAASESKPAAKEAE